MRLLMRLVNGFPIPERVFTVILNSLNNNIACQQYRFLSHLAHPAHEIRGINRHLAVDLRFCPFTCMGIETEGTRITNRSTIAITIPKN